MRTLILGGLAVATIMTGGCTTRGDVWNARQDLRDAQQYGDRRDVRDARRELRRTRRDYQDDNRCGPRWGRRC